MGGSLIRQRASNMVVIMAAAATMNTRVWCASAIPAPRREERNPARLMTMATNPETRANTSFETQSIDNSG